MLEVKSVSESFPAVNRNGNFTFTEKQLTEPRLRAVIVVSCR